jgi:hypothetical protein
LLINSRILTQVLQLKQNLTRLFALIEDIVPRDKFLLAENLIDKNSCLADKVILLQVGIPDFNLEALVCSLNNIEGEGLIPVRILTSLFVLLTLKLLPIEFDLTVRVYLSQKVCVTGYLPAYWLRNEHLRHQYGT